MTRTRELQGYAIALALAVLLPFIEGFAFPGLGLAEDFRPIFIFAILGLGLNIIVGYTGLLNLGVAAFMAIGAYSYGILTCDIYPFQLSFWSATAATIVVGALAGVVLGLPAIRLHGDYLAIVTLGFGEIVQDALRNLETITKGTQGINPLPSPRLFGVDFQSGSYLPWYFLLLFILCSVALLVRNLERSRIGRAWIAVREDELAARCMGINPVRAKLLAFSLGASLCSLAGALWASYLGSTGEPGNYDFQVSVIVLCVVMVGGMGSILGVMLGAVVMVGFNSIVLSGLSDLLARQGILSGENVFAVPGNWKYFIFGLALILVTRYRPEGLIPSRVVKIVAPKKAKGA
ncbi:MAG: branched-chain amino acid ABC transporter permease [Deltaproteobacteria bacterium]|nr:branched-chain amino acid ABC transporter permease [Deltaproteobacteria bacterium]